MSPKPNTACRDLIMMPSWVLLEAQNPLSEGFGFFFGDGVWRHRDRTPVTLGAVLDVAGEQIGSAILTGVFGGDFFQSRADHFGVDAVAGRAGLALEQRFTVLSHRGLQDHCAAEGEQWDENFFHELLPQG
ncbi:hypothetical protein PSEUDO9AG_50613 [Pseudomonas sp. 9Ag]|nr:hypothetical protein PSEUDO9AG_50613 [Pseudomonas sp. 9Ag]